MRVTQSFVVNLLPILLALGIPPASTELEIPSPDVLPLTRRLQQEGSPHFLKNGPLRNAAFIRDNNEFVRMLVRKRNADNNVLKTSEITAEPNKGDGGGIGVATAMIENPNLQNSRSKVVDILQTPATPKLVGDNGILGTSDEDSAKWAMEEMRNAAQETTNQVKNDGEQQTEGPAQLNVTVQNKTYQALLGPGVMKSSSSRKVSLALKDKLRGHNMTAPVLGQTMAQSNETLNENLQLGKDRAANGVVNLKINSQGDQDAADLGEKVMHATLAGGSQLPNKTTVKDANLNLQDNNPTVKPVEQDSLKMVNESENSTVKEDTQANMVAKDSQEAQQSVKVINDSSTVQILTPKVTVTDQLANATPLELPKVTKPSSNIPIMDTPQTQTSPEETQPSSENASSLNGNEASLAVNITSLRQRQSFDLQMPSTTSLSGTYQDNRIHLSPNDVVKESRPLPKDSGGITSDGSFLNETMDNVNAVKQENIKQPNEVLQKLNSDVLSPQIAQFNDRESPDNENNDDAFGRDRDVMPAGRTFTANYIGSEDNDVLSSSQPNSLPGREEQAEIQQDESLARALNDSSASSIIFSANQAIFDTDKAAFAKKSTRGGLISKQLDHRNKRADALRRLRKQIGKNGVKSKIVHHDGRHKAKISDTNIEGTRRQVIDIGNHLLWFGGQGAADADGFPRHKTEEEGTQYNPLTAEEVNFDNTNLVNTRSRSNSSVSKTTKGFKDLEHALNSMETNQQLTNLDPPTSSFDYGLPTNKAQNDQKQGTNVLIQDDSGKPVYQGVVDIVKLNKTDSNETQDNIVHNQDRTEELGETGSGENSDQKNLENGTNTIETEKLSSNTGTGNTTQVEDKEQSNNITITEEYVEKNSPNQNRTGLSPQSAGKNSTSQQLTSAQSKYDQQLLWNQKTSQGNNEQAIQDHSKGKSGEQIQSPEQSVQNGDQPSAVIRKISKSSNGEPETYHVVVNDAGRKLTNGNGHVTLIISGPTAQQASMIGDNTLLIPQANPPNSLPGKDGISPMDNLSDSLSENANFLKPLDIQHETANDQSASGAGQEINSTQQMGALANKEKESGTKVPLEIVGKVNKVPSGGSQTTEGTPSQIQGALNNPRKNPNSQSTENLMQLGHTFLKVDQDLAKGADGLQMQEVSRPEVNPAMQEEDKLLQGLGAEGLEQGESSLSVQAQDVPTLNLVLNPAQQLDGSLSVGGKVIPLTSGIGRPSYISEATVRKQQRLDCHAQPRKGQTTITVLTCQKKQSLARIPQELNQQQHSFLGNNLYFGGNPSPPGGGSQLDQVMNLLNDQVKTTINKEMKSESKDIENILTGMDVPTSSLMDTEEPYSEIEPSDSARRTPPTDTEERYSPETIFQRPNKWLPQHRFQLHRHHFNMPHFQQPPWGIHHHHHPMVVMAHRDKDEGFWDYQHNIWIPRASDQDDDRDSEGERREGQREYHNDDYDDDDDRENHWVPWAHHGHRRGNWLMAHPPWQPHHGHFYPSRDLFHLRMPTLFGRSGPWKPPHHAKATPQVAKQQPGAKRTAVVHKTLRGDRDLCRPIIEGPSPPLNSEWEYLGKVLCSCRGGLSDSEW